MLLLPLAHAEDATFKSWQATCDNLQTCSAFVVVEDQLFTGFLLIRRGNGPTDEPELVVGPWSDGTAATFVLTTVGGAKPATLTIPMNKPDDEVAVARGAPARLFVEALADASAVRGVVKTTGESGVSWPRAGAGESPGETSVSPGSYGAVTVQSGGTEIASFDLSGSSATLRWIDAAQHRAGTVTALVAKGPKAAETVVPPKVPIVARGPFVSQDALPAAPSAALAADPGWKECQSEMDQSGQTLTVDRLAPDVLLWGTPCGSGAYNFSTRYWLSTNDGRKVRPAGIPGAESDLLVNAGYDVNTRTLSAFSKGRGLGDCGALQSWVWDGKAFVATDAWFMGTCAGMPIDYWPRAVHAEVR